jgi:16S rRNA (guanine1516-N2)-methyltransferase
MTELNENNLDTIRKTLPEGLSLIKNETGLALVYEDQVLHGDFIKMIPRLKHHNLTGELLVKAAKIKDADYPLKAIDATAGLGDDSILLAAAGFEVEMYERNPVIHALLADTIERAKQIPELAETVNRMHLHYGGSADAMKQQISAPDVILLDPMFPARQKNALVKKKLQMIQKLEMPCVDEGELLLTAMALGPRKLIVKRPPKGPHLAGVKPDYSSEGKAVRFDCFVQPKDRLEAFKKKIASME